MNDMMRKRGWSIASNDKDKRTTDTTNETTVFPPRNGRERANTDQSEDTLTPSQKEELLKFPDMEELEEEEEELDSRVKAIDSGGKKRRGGLVERNGGGGVDSEDSEGDIPDAAVTGPDRKEDDVIDMVGDDDDDEDDNGKDLPPKKKVRLNNEEVIHIQDNEDDDDTEEEEKKEQSEDLQKLEDRKNKLSKWASRLFDPNRPRGLVETPKVIPLNDEYLKDFGARERDFANSTGKEIEIDRGNLDEEEEDMEQQDSIAMKDGKAKMGGIKVRTENFLHLCSSCKKHTYSLGSIPQLIRSKSTSQYCSL